MVNAALPAWSSVLAVVAHPDDESFGLGAVLASFVSAGARVSVLCLTHGEASTLHGVDGDLAVIREAELADAARTLGVHEVLLRSYPDGGLSGLELDALTADIDSVVTDCGSDGLVVFDDTGVTGHPDHCRATTAAVVVAREKGLPVLAWTLPVEVANELRAEFDAPFVGHPADQIDIVLDVDRRSQREAVSCHPSQAVPGSALWRRLELLGDREYLRWLG